MKFGVCTGLDIAKTEYIKQLGYDYAEGHCVKIVNASDEEIEELKKIDFPMPTANCFMPGELKIITDEDNKDEINAYLSKLFERASYLGIKILVFGSSGARRIPDGMSVSEGRKIIAEFLGNQVAPLAEKYDITVAIEPLRPAECNAINTVADGIEVAKATGSNRIKVLADVAHNFVQNEDIEGFAQLGEWLVHAHISNPAPDASLGKKRIFPTVNDEYDLTPFINSMKAAGVERISIEAEMIDFETDAAKAMELLKKFK